MRSMLLALGLSLVASLTFTWLARRLALHWGALDRPDGKRKLHARPVPLWGGVAVYLAFALAGLAVRQVALISYTPFHDISWVLILSAGLICLLGTIDDSWDLNGRFKLLLQVVSMVPILATGYFIRDIELFGTSIHLGIVGLPLTVLFLLGSINSLNLLDGMDGMTGTVGCAAASLIGLTAFLLGHQHVAVMSMLLVGSLLGFLWFNRPPATIYLGDSGSTTVGLLIGITALEGFRTESGAVALVASVVALTLPVVDTSLAIIRRVLTGKRFDTPDRGHIHHRLQEGGRPITTALWITAGCGVAAGFGAMAARLTHQDGLGLAAAASVLTWAALRGWFGRYELALVASRLSHRFRQAMLHASAVQGKSLATSQLAPRNFLTDWHQLIEHVAPYPADLLELVVTDHHGTTLARHLWQRPAEPRPSEHEWQLSFSFATTSPEYRGLELRASGYDLNSSQPAYLVSLAELLQAFGDHWGQQLESVPETRLRYFDGLRETNTDGWRDAA